MLINDYHIHSRFSGDSNEDLDKIIEKGIELGMSDMAITDHLEYDIVGMTDKWKLNLDDYVSTILKYKEKYKDKIDLKLGVEIGIQPHTREHLEKQVEKYPFDFVIASTHALDRHDIAMGELQKHRNKEQLQRYYFETVLKNVKTYNNFNVYGHIDFITRYGGSEYRGLNYKENLDLIDEILRTLISKNKGIEINTSGYRYKEDRFYPCTDLLKRYFELGGEIITIGSDSHIKDYIGKDFDIAYDFLKSIGVNYICSFDQMQPVFKKIK
ncbi:histidinol-phosphatase HisJ family protein [Fusobacterium sp.]|uniref:histidinol-phosphatase HisJ family protein n=1 Tax=Fusobacterium sp. TaxID=68766 RepID=UPI00396CA39B